MLRLLSRGVVKTPWTSPSRAVKCNETARLRYTLVGRAISTQQPPGSTPHNSHTEDESDISDIPDFGAYSVILPPEPFVYGTSHIRSRLVPPHIPRPSYASGRLEDENAPEIVTVEAAAIAETEGLEALRAAAQLARDALKLAGTLIQPGIRTDSIDDIIHEYIISHNAYPSPLRYKGFPRSICTSVNNVIAHGIPDDRPLADGDIVNVDITVFHRGHHGDTSRTFLVGNVDAPGRELVRASEAALEAGIQACGPGRPFNGIGRAIHKLISSPPYSFGLGHHISPVFTGHGIGTLFHKRPWIIPEHNDETGIMRPGDCFTIEPCVVQGARGAGAWTFPDGWTVSTENCARSAQAEHTVLVTEQGVEVLTR